MAALQVRVAARRQEAQDICSFDLVSAEVGSALPGFSPGAHVDVQVPGGWVRQYSLWNDCAEQGIYRIGVLKDAAGRGGSLAMHEAVPPGTLLQISRPRNQFPLAPAAPHSLLLAGGIGITPLLSMAQTLSRNAVSFDLHCCTRSLARTAFLERLRAPGLAQHLHLHLDDGPPGQRLDLAQTLRTQPVGTHLYVCGPKGFMEAALNTARQMGWPEQQLHFEFFAAEPLVQGGDQPFQVKLARSGRVVDVGRAQTVLQALVAAGVEVPSSCEQGICGTCVTPVLDGTPDHRDSYLMPHEHAANNCFTPCCSRARTPCLVLDL